MLRRISSRVVAVRPQVRSFSGAHEHITIETKGGAPGEIPTIFNQGVGKAYEEAVAEQQGFHRFNRGGLEGPFGTVKDPVYVLSDYAYRIVGCVGGGGGLKHHVLWFNLTRGPKHACRACGQVFKLVNADEWPAHLPKEYTVPEDDDT